MPQAPLSSTLSIPLFRAALNREENRGETPLWRHAQQMLLTATRRPSIWQINTTVTLTAARKRATLHSAFWIGLKKEGRRTQIPIPTSSCAPSFPVTASAIRRS